MSEIKKMDVEYVVMYDKADANTKYYTIVFESFITILATIDISKDLVESELQVAKSTFGSDNIYKWFKERNYQYESTGVEGINYIIDVLPFTMNAYLTLNSETGYYEIQYRYTRK